VTGEPIVCFAKDWDDQPTSNNHVMRLLARDRPVLWVSSIGMRRPRAGVRDVRRMARRLVAALRGPRHVADGLWVLAPLALPLPHSRAATAINRRLLGTRIRRAARTLGLGRFQVWSFLPNTTDYAADLDPTLLVYYCVDDWAHAEGYDGAGLEALERRLCARADLVFATSEPLAAAKRRLNPHTHVSPHGVDHAHFARALDPATPRAPELDGIAGPLVTVVGLLDERLDLPLLAHLASRRPDVALVLVGRAHVDLGGLRRAHPNVHVVGHCPYARLPEILRASAVALVPFVVNEYTRHVNPVKLREYLSAGLPVVSTALPEVARYGRWCRIARDPDAFVAAVGEAIATDSPALRRERSDALRGETWERRVAEIDRVVARAREARAA
jgi:glycosyltransferase involved in cell wall biosynthesis